MTDTNTQSSRRLKYGANLILLTAIALGTAGALAYVTSKYSARADVSSAQVNSLSPRTKKLLQQVDAKGVKYELVSTFIEGTVDREGRDRAQQVDDLLSNYARASKSVTIGSRDGLDVRIRERFSGELKQYETAVSGYEDLFKKLESFSKNEAASFGAISQQPGLSANDQRELQAIQGLFNDSIPEILKRTRERVRKSTDSTVPEWSTAVSRLKDTITQLTTGLKQFTGEDGKQLSRAVQNHIKESAADYASMISAMEAYNDKLSKLPALKSDDIYASLGTNCVVVLAPDTVKVLSLTDIYKSPRQMEESPSDEPQSKFEGEQALSTALLGLSEPNKKKVVFIGSQAGMTTGQYSALADILNRANFQVLEWAPPSPQQQQQPQQQPQLPEPPAEGKGVTYIVFPPEFNPQTMMMGMPPANPQPLINAVQKHLDDGGSALFLAEASSPFMAMMGGSGGYPFDPVIKPFGVDVEAKYTVVQAFPAQNNKTQTVPQLMVNRFPSTPITDPLQTLDTVFAGQMSRMGFMGGPTPVLISKDKPTDITAMVIVETEKSDTVWAESNPTMESKFNPESDLKSPVSLGVAAEKGTGEKSQRIIVLGNRIMASNQAIESARYAVRGQSLVALAQFPGNGELLLNSVYWLSNYDSMIAVSPQASAALRIKAISPTATTTIRTAAILGPPILAILIGATVFIIRRRA